MTRSRARLAGCTMAYSRCSRVRAAVSPRCHQAAASCWRRRSPHSGSERVEGGASLRAGNRGCIGLRCRPPKPRCRTRLAEPAAARAGADHRATHHDPCSPDISRISRPAIRPGSVPAIAAAPARRGPSPRSCREFFPPAPGTPATGANADQGRQGALPVENASHLEPCLQCRRHRNDHAGAQVSRGAAPAPALALLHSRRGPRKVVVNHTAKARQVESLRGHVGGDEVMRRQRVRRSIAPEPVEHGSAC